MQNYLHLESMSQKEAVILFKFRKKMAPFGENFKAGQFRTKCTLCFTHIDSQEESCNCVAMNKLMKIRGKYCDIFSDQVSQDLVRTLSNIYNFRKESNEK